MRFRSFYLLALLLGFTFAWKVPHAQSLDPQAGRVWILQEGSRSRQGSIGFVDFPCGVYQHWDSIPAFSSDIVAIDGYLLVAGSDGRLRIYDEHAASTNIVDMPVRKMAITRWDDHYLMVASCTAHPFVRVVRFDRQFNEMRVLWISDNEQAPNETDGVAINAQATKAYISMNGFNGFGINGVTDNRVIVISLEPRIDFLTHIQVQANPQSLVWGQRNGVVNDSLWVQSLDYAANGLGITIINSQNDRVIFSDTTRILSYGGFVYRDGILFNRVNPQNFSTEALAYYQIGQPVVNLLEGNFTALGFNPRFGYLALAQSDYVSTGLVDFVDERFNRLSIPTNISPAVFAFEHISKVSTRKVELNLAGNPQQTVNFVPSLAGPRPQLSWSDGNTNATRSFTRCGTYTLRVNLSPRCTFESTYDVKLDNRPDFTFSNPDTIRITTPEFSLFGQLSRHANARWRVEERLELLSSDRTDEIRVRIKGNPSSGWYRFSVELTTDFCSYVYADSVFILLPTGLKPELTYSSVRWSIYPYPNPVQNSSFRLLSQDGIAYSFVSLFNLQGRCVRKWSHESTEFDVADLPAGIYYLSIEDASRGKSYIHRLIIE